VAVQIFWRDDRQAIGNQPLAVERFQEIAAQGAAILALGPRFGFELDPAKAGATFGTDGTTHSHRPHYALKTQPFQDVGAHIFHIRHDDFSGRQRFPSSFD
jgi:hypothetical protein